MRAAPGTMSDKAVSLPDLPGSYARWRRSRLGRITDAIEERLVLELLGDVEGLDVLNVGCGDGALASVLARRGARVTGLDPDTRMLAAAQARADAALAKFDLIRGEAEVLPFADDAFDRVVAVTVLCFVPEPDRAIAEMSRVLKPGGRLVIGELGRWSIWATGRPIRGWFGASTWSTAHFRTARELRTVVQRHGLRARDTRGSVYYPPWGMAASLMAPVDPWLGRQTTLGAAFIAMSAVTPSPHIHDTRP